MEISQTAYVVCFWVWEAENANLIANLSREPYAAKWTLQVNVRLFQDDKIWGSSDKRIKATNDIAAVSESDAAAEAVAKLRVLAMAFRGPYTESRIDVHGDQSKAMSALMTHPSIHMESKRMDEDGNLT